MISLSVFGKIRNFFFININGSSSLIIHSPYFHIKRWIMKIWQIWWYYENFTYICIEKQMRSSCHIWGVTYRYDKYTPKKLWKNILRELCERHSSSWSNKEITEWYISGKWCANGYCLLKTFTKCCFVSKCG